MADRLDKRQSEEKVSNLAVSEAGVSESNVSQAAGVNNSEKKDWITQIERIARILERLIWLFVLLIIAAAVANFLKMQSPQLEASRSVVRPVPVVRSIPPNVDRAIAIALQGSRNETLEFAANRLDSWKASVMQRVDDYFLPWYFGYFNQQALGLKYLFQGAYHGLNSKAATPEESLIQEIQKEFEQRVLPPELAQATFADLVQDSVQFYTEALSRRIDAIPSQYQIPQADWVGYVRDLGLITNRAEANREVSLTEKGVAVTVGTSGALVAGKVASKVASKTASKVAVKSGAKLAGKIGAEALGSVFGVGIIVWDVWDHQHTKATQLPILRQNIEEYLDQVKASLLKDSTSGLISTIYDLESQVVKNAGMKGA